MNAEIDRIVKTWQSDKYKDCMLPGLGSTTCGNVASLIAAQPAQADADHHATAARYQRLHKVCSRILWTDIGVPAMENAQTRAALAELAEIMFTDALIKANAAAQDKGGDQ